MEKPNTRRRNTSTKISYIPLAKDYSDRQLLMEDRAFYVLCILLKSEESIKDSKLLPIKAIKLVQEFQQNFNQLVKLLNRENY